MKFSNWLRILAVSGCIAATAVSAGAFSCSDFERSGGGPYKETLDALYENMTAGEGSNDQLAGSVGIMETVNALGREAALQGTGFSIEDITGDGVPELLVGSMPGSGESVYAVYTIRNGTPAAVFDGWARNGYYALGGGRFYYHGSGGAAYSAFGTCHLSYDGSRIEWEDFYFSDIKDSSAGTIGYFHNTTGIWKKAEAEELFISRGRFFEMDETLRTGIRAIGKVPFSEYACGHEAAADGTVQAHWAEDALSDYGEYDEFMAETSEYQVRVLFSTQDEVRDFRVLRLVPDLDEEGNMTFFETELYYAGRLTAERPLVLGMVFHGDTPGYGISYTDGNGRTRRFYIGMSGDDGSLFLGEF